MSIGSTAAAHSNAGGKGHDKGSTLALLWFKKEIDGLMMHLVECFGIEPIILTSVVRLHADSHPFTILQVFAEQHAGSQSHLCP